MLEQALQFVTVYVLVVFRVAAMLVFAPLLGSARVPRRVKGLMACVVAAGLAPGVSLPARMPDTPWGLAVGIGGEIVFGLSMGMVMSFIYIAAQWAGAMIGQQMGLNMSETLDPQFGGSGSVVGDMYYFLATIIFLAIRGHHALINGISHSFSAMPLLSVGMNQSVLDLLTGLFQSATVLAVQLTAPILVTMLVVDVSLGFIGKTMPQLNIMSAGITVRTLMGMVVIIVGIGLTSTVIRGAMADAMKIVVIRYGNPL